MGYSDEEVRRIAHVGFKAAMKRKKRVVSVDKANILESSRLLAERRYRRRKAVPGAELSHMYVDNAAMQLYGTFQFDVILTENMFGTYCPTRPQCLPALSACCHRQA
jgi:3-isopropylmalate dehydrogenase